MKRISLLPPEIKSKRLANIRISKLYMFMVIAILIIIFINLYLLLNAYFIRQDLQALQTERDFSDSQAAALAEYELLNQQYISIKELVNDAMGDAPNWSTFMVDISKNIPVGTQLSEIRIDFSDEIGVLILQGRVADYNGLASLLDSLDNLEQIDQIQCRVSTETGVAGDETVQFLIESVILAGTQFIDDDLGGD